MGGLREEAGTREGNGATENVPISELYVQLALPQALRMAEDGGGSKGEERHADFHLGICPEVSCPSHPFHIKHMQMATVINSDNDRVSI